MREYAYILENGIVGYGERRGIPIEKLFPKAIIEKYFAPVPDNLKGKVAYGWSYDREANTFSEPEIFAPIPDTNDVYIPDNKKDTAEYIGDLQAVMETARSSFSLMIANDIDNGTEIMTSNMILDNADLLSKKWAADVPNKKGDIIFYNEQYYKCITDTLNADPNHTPDLIPAVFVPIDRTHEGTMDDPIPAVSNMVYLKDKYYIQDDALYLCTRDSGIPLNYLPSELIGQYFETVNLG